MKGAIFKSSSILLLCLISILPGYARQAPEDTLAADIRNLSEGRTVANTGRSMLLAGGLTALAGGAMVAIPMLIPRPDEFHEDMLGALSISIGAVFALVGSVTMIAGIPVTVAGRGMMGSEGYWRDNRYGSPGQRGFGCIVDIAGFIPWAQVRATAGYHFNKNIFLGAGAGVDLNFADMHNEYVSMVSIPVYLDFRYSMADRFCSPYLGVSAGYAFLGESPYLGADLGVRLRLDTERPTSLWASITGEVSGNMLVGLKLGWSF